MYCSKDIQFACQCLPQRLKPQTAASVAVFPFPYAFRFSRLFRNIQTVSYSIYLQCLSVPALYRAKNRKNIGLLALFFCRYLKHNERRGIRGILYE